MAPTSIIRAKPLPNLREKNIQFQLEVERLCCSAVMSYVVMSSHSRLVSSALVFVQSNRFCTVSAVVGFYLAIFSVFLSVNKDYQFNSTFFQSTLSRPIMSVPDKNFGFTTSPQLTSINARNTGKMLLDGTVCRRTGWPS